MKITDIKVAKFTERNALIVLNDEQHIVIEVRQRPSSWRRWFSDFEDHEKTKQYLKSINAIADYSIEADVEFSKYEYLFDNV